MKSKLYPLLGLTTPPPPTVAQFISSPGDVGPCQIADKCRDTTLAIEVLQTSLPPFPYTRRTL